MYAVIVKDAFLLKPSFPCDISSALIVGDGLNALSLPAYIDVPFLFVPTLPLFWVSPYFSEKD